MDSEGEGGRASKRELKEKEKSKRKRLRDWETETGTGRKSENMRTPKQLSIFLWSLYYSSQLVCSPANRTQSTNAPGVR